MQCLLIVCQYVSTGCLRAPIGVQDEVAQEEVQGKEAGRSLLKPALISPAGWQDAQDLLSNPANEHGLI